MPKILVKTKHTDNDKLLKDKVHPGYNLVFDKSVFDYPALIAADPSIHAVLVDSDKISPELVYNIRAAAKDNLFPVILIDDSSNEDEINRWASVGVSEIIQLPLPASVIGMRIANVIRLYCMSRSLHDQSFDRLTGLYNISAFYHYARQFINDDPDAEYSIVISDIDQFKLINERYGEETGDTLLRHIGDFLMATRNENKMFGRYGADQFVGLVRMVDHNKDLNEMVLESEMQRQYATAPVEHFRVKFGMYENVDKSLPVSIMCDRAKMALIGIKHQYGRTLSKYTPQMQQKFNREQQILESMEKALNDGQFQVYYQPKHNIHTSEIVGLEALVRWFHPEYGFLSPEEFIPLFERSDFISRLDRFVWEHVCKDMKEQLTKGNPVVPVSINVSRKDIVRELFMQVVRNPLEKMGLDANLFHMEMTESIYTEDPEVLAPLIRKLRGLGIKIEIDDFGSGFSSLGILSRIPADIVKMDSTLIQNMENQPVIVESLINMMHTLGYQVIAEGIETDHQLEMLKRMGCDIAQGFYYSKPLTASGIENYIRDYNNSNARKN